MKDILMYPDMPPRAHHEAWLKWKIEEGWVYGTEKDAEKKTHPCLVPYEQLPIEQRAKDYLFGIVVRAKLGLPLPDVSYSAT